MSELKPFASLSSSLLARKGSARPAMRPQAFGKFSGGADDLGWNDMGYGAADLEEPHHDHVPSPIHALTPMTGALEDEEFEAQIPVVEHQRAMLEATFAKKPMNEAEFEEALLSGAIDEAHLRDLRTIEAPEPTVVQQPLAKPVKLPASPKANGKGKTAFTLRLDQDRHLKLRLACAVSGRSAQQLVTEALDRLLEARPEIGALAGQVAAE